jgi:hypothetical protein
MTWQLDNPHKLWQSVFFHFLDVPCSGICVLMALHHHLAEGVIKDGHIVLLTSDLLEYQHEANPEIMSMENASRPDPR